MSDDQNTQGDDSQTEDNNTAAKVAVGIGAGLVAGAIAGAVVADHKEEIGDKVDDMKDQAQDKWEDVKEGVQDRVDDLMRKLEDVRSQVQEALSGDAGNEEYTDMAGSLDTWSEKLQNAKDQGADNLDELLGEISDALNEVKEKLQKSRNSSGNE